MSSTLLDVLSGEKVTVARLLTGDSATKQRLLDMGLTRGTEIYVERVAPLGDPVQIRVKGYRLAIRKREAGLVEIESPPDDRRSLDEE